MTVLGGSAGFIWYVDPGNRYRLSGFEQKAGDAFAALWQDGGHAIVLKPTHNERQFVRAIIPSLDPPPEIVVMGSSRIMEVGDDAFSSRTLNLGMSGATFEDFAALAMLFDERALKPAGVVLTIDPWSFNVATNQDRWLHLADAYARFRVRAGLPPDGRTARAASLGGTLANNLLSYGAIAGAFEVARRPVMHAPISHVETPPGPSNMFLKMRDGTIRYPPEIENRQSDEVAAIARGFARDGGYGMMGYREPDQNAVDLLRAVVHWFDASGTKVVFVLVPYHPAPYAELATMGQTALVPLENYIRRLAVELDIPVVGSYDPSQANCSADDFTDALHPRRDCVRRQFVDSRIRFLQ